MTTSALIGGAVTVAIAATFALSRGPLPVHQLRDKPFNDTLHEDLATLAAASERIEALNKPKVVQTESIRPIEPDPLMVALSEPAMAPPPSRKAESDVCARHGLRKIITNSGRSWRCRK